MSHHAQYRNTHRREDGKCTRTAYPRSLHRAAFRGLVGPLSLGRDTAVTTAGPPNRRSPGGHATLIEIWTCVVILTLARTHVQGVRNNMPDESSAVADLRFRFPPYPLAGGEGRITAHERPNLQG